MDVHPVDWHGFIFLSKIVYVCPAAIGASWTGGIKFLRNWATVHNESGHVRDIDPSWEA